jgi:hypothetical protein
MLRLVAAIALFVGLALPACPIIAFGQSAPHVQAAQPPTYRPGLGDLMTMTVQPRHTKLGLAGREKNWAYAAYELHELEESFERAGRAWPRWRSFPIPDMIGALTKEPMAAVSQAIKNGDASSFAAAYDQLTASCNACHQAAGRAVIVIQVPAASSFPDQDFHPAKP